LTMLRGLCESQHWEPACTRAEEVATP
jgi:hypothetical protein